MQKRQKWYGQTVHIKETSPNSRIRENCVFLLTLFPLACKLCIYRSAAATFRPHNDFFHSIIRSPIRCFHWTLALFLKSNIASYSPLSLHALIYTPRTFHRGRMSSSSSSSSSFTALNASFSKHNSSFYSKLISNQLLNSLLSHCSRNETFQVILIYLQYANISSASYCSYFARICSL